MRSARDLWPECSLTIRSTSLFRSRSDTQTSLLCDTCRGAPLGVVAGTGKNWPTVETRPCEWTVWVEVKMTPGIFVSTNPVVSVTRFRRVGVMCGPSRILASEGCGRVRNLPGASMRGLLPASVIGPTPRATVGCRGEEPTLPPSARNRLPNRELFPRPRLWGHEIRPLFGAF